MIGVWRWVIASALLLYAVQPKEVAPLVQTSYFPNIPGQLRYFDGSSTVLWHDKAQGMVYVSNDEGKSWSPIKGPAAAEAQYLIMHPYDSRQAYVLSNGLQHWRTSNRGKTWQRFQTPDPPTQRLDNPLDFHADEKHYNHVIFSGKRCQSGFFKTVCRDVAYYTTDGFASNPQLLLDPVTHCRWAKMTKDISISEDSINKVYCIAWDESAQRPKGSLSKRDVLKNRLFESTDFFQTRKSVVFDDLASPRGFIDLGKSRNFLITALQDNTPGYGGELRMYVTQDGESWKRARFPHGQLEHESAYTVLEGPKYHLIVEVLDQSNQNGVLFMSDGSGTNFSMSIPNVVRNQNGFVDYEHLANIEGVAIVNVQAQGKIHRVQTRITHDEGASWLALRPPSHDVDGHTIPCNPNLPDQCALHLHAVTSIRNLGRVFSSTAPGLVIGVGSIGDRLLPYEECDTFLSIDAGVTWTMVARYPHKHVFGDQGGLLVLVQDSQSVDQLKYSFDYGAHWQALPLPKPVEPIALTTAPDGTALKVLLIGSQKRGSVSEHQRHMSIFVDFATLPKRTCKANDFEKFYPQTPGSTCLFGHKQWYLRRKAEADCFVREKFHEPQGKEEPCACTQADYECDLGFERRKGQCLPSKPIEIPPGACSRGQTTFMGPSGYRRIPGNTCQEPNGQGLDAPVQRPCSEGEPVRGTVSHTRFDFPAPMEEVLHFRASPHILARLQNGQLFQSADDGSTWHEVPLYVDGRVTDVALRIVAHPYERQQAFVITSGSRVHSTLNGGVTWSWFTAPLPPNQLGLEPLGFHPQHSSWLLWTGARDCEEGKKGCRAEVWYSTGNSHQRWERVDSYVKKCAFLPTQQFPGDERTILCEHYDPSELKTNRPLTQIPVDLVMGREFYSKKQTVFRHILGFSVFDRYMLVAELAGSPPSLRMHVSLDGYQFAPLTLPPSLQLDHRAYTVLDSVTRAVFLHVTTHDSNMAQWGDIVKSNSNGTYYALSLENVNRDGMGFVDFEKMLGLDGIALANVVANSNEASLSGVKQLRTMITHNDGGHWKSLDAPAVDSHGSPYPCNQVGCNLHLHNLLERPDLRITLSSPSATGFMLATGNVGRSLLPYAQCDTFLTRDGGFTWEEVHKNTHKWEYGDHGSIIVLVDDQHATDTLLYTLDQGLTWETYRFGEKMRVSTLDTVPEDTKRKFVLMGESQGRSTAVFLDFTRVLSQPCVFDRDEERNDFERWSPSQQREEACLFGSQTWFWRRKRDRVCYVGEAMPEQEVEKKPCTCSAADFECEFNHFRDARGHCVLYPGVTALPSDEGDQCSPDHPDYDGYWYERTNVRKIPLSRCVGGERPDRGRRHACRAARKGHGFFWWLMIFAVSGALGYGVAHWWTRQGYQALSLEEVHQSPAFRNVSEQLHLAAHFVGGLLSLTWANLMALGRNLPWIRNTAYPDRPFSHYHMLSTDEDAEILQDYGSDLEPA
ncbi:vacuolar protein sorting/targeting protein PEP1 [Malassezia nana]|uniref:Vacuolar protein sorting/targeting protein PEP1 n=1 Tax=Malassezia nana TaxID=180528 RepID=A0AAF0J211_9BASI|nr:vacuolar protein sorting/targeting protein PEP1 [Malassezia nana]